MQTNNETFLQQSQHQLSMTLFHGYRMVLSALLFLLPLFGLLPRQHNIVLYMIGAGIYLSLTIIAILIAQQEQEQVKPQTLAVLIIDLIGLSLMVHATGGISAGFATLLVISVVLGSLVLKNRACYILAATASIALMIETLVTSLTQEVSVFRYTQTGLYGLTFFITAFLGHILSAKLKNTEALNVAQKADILALESVNSAVIQELVTGIIVLDEQQQALLINHKAWQLMGKIPCQLPCQLPQICAPLAQALQQHKHSKHFKIDLEKNVSIYRHQLNYNRTFISIEDNQAIAKQAQNLKLASLGRFTASIAHEIRNPLYAINHATQLLLEQNTNDDDRKLLNIIYGHCDRLNAIINNILQLSQQRKSSSSKFELNAWLEQFAANYITSVCDSPKLKVSKEQEPLLIRFDKTQLEQILGNLIDNGLQQGLEHCQCPEVELLIRHTDDLAYVHLLDRGPGVATNQKDNLFEPFFTTHKKGTGLGLYISQTLATANNAQLYYNEQFSSGACFSLKIKRIHEQGSV